MMSASVASARAKITLPDRELDGFFRLLVAAGGVDPVRVEFLVDSLEPPAWVVSCVEWTATIPGVHVTVDVQRSRPESAPVWRKWRTNSLTVRRLPEHLIRPVGEGATPHVVINCSSAEVPGAWWFAIDARQRIHPDQRELFLHAAQGPRAIDLSLRTDQRELAALRASPWDGMDWQRHAATLESGPALILLALSRRGQESAAARAFPPMKPPGALRIAKFAAAKTLRSMKARATGRDIAAGWQIGLRNERLENFHRVPPGGWRWIQGFPGHQAADPFLVEDGSNLWLFYEDIVPPKGFGRLAVLPALDPQAEPRVILEKPYHLSYPFVFKHDGAWWMIPESGANRSVDLYRARAFPYEWEHIRTLMSGYRLADATPIFHHGLWYFFTCTWLAGRAQAGLLFTAESLESTWRLHPSSPLTLDSAEARGAGPVFQQEGRMYRPVQDCLTKYGYAITFREILELTPSVCREQTVCTLQPGWHAGIEAMHTFCQSSRACVIDGQKRT
jgi:hypothetical protein